LKESKKESKKPTVLRNNRFEVNNVNSATDAPALLVKKDLRCISLHYFRYKLVPEKTHISFVS
jgi:hypothetical protein